MFYGKKIKRKPYDPLYIAICVDISMADQMRIFGAIGMENILKKHKNKSKKELIDMVYSYKEEHRGE